MKRDDSNTIINAGIFREELQDDLYGLRTCTEKSFSIILHYVLHFGINSVAGVD